MGIEYQNQMIYMVFCSFNILFLSYSGNAVKYHTKINLISLISESIKQCNPIPEQTPESYELVLFSKLETLSATCAAQTNDSGLL